MRQDHRRSAPHLLAAAAVSTAAAVAAGAATLGLLAVRADPDPLALLAAVAGFVASIVAGVTIATYARRGASCTSGSIRPSPGEWSR